MISCTALSEDRALAAALGMARFNSPGDSARPRRSIVLKAMDEVLGAWVTSEVYREPQPVLADRKRSGPPACKADEGRDEDDHGGDGGPDRESTVRLEQEVGPGKLVAPVRAEQIGEALAHTQC
jgi:hypothetical protein